MVITSDNMDEYVVTGEFVISASVRPELGSDESKKVTLKFKMENTPVRDIIASSLKDKRINWQNSKRKHFNSIIDGSTVLLKYEGGREPIDPKANYGLWFASLSKEEQEAEIERLKAL